MTRKQAIIAELGEVWAIESPTLWQTRRLLELETLLVLEGVDMEAVLELIAAGHDADIAAALVATGVDLANPDNFDEALEEALGFLAGRGES